MNECQQIYLYFYGELKTPEKFSKHLQSCSFCQNQLAFLQKMSKAMDFEKVQNSEITKIKFKQRFSSPYNKSNKQLFVAAVIILCSFIAILPFNYSQQSAVKYSDNIDKDISELRHKIKNLSQRKFSKHFHNKSLTKIKNKIAKLKTSKIW
ncbi:hypothetical protein [Candidatus Uabimicrobium sp. HlEnr_7]|uniref:hypothetical protein n=1 Tax=Candidatus Uabimicrobium helgolandensis TaxID=3095367 RepID=UPI0035578183